MKRLLWAVIPGAAVVLGLAPSLVACGQSSATSAPGDGQGSGGAGGSTATAPECSGSTPVRYVVANPNDPFGPDVHDACEAIPPGCAAPDSGTICDCLAAAKAKRNDAGASGCLGNGEIYCDALDGGSFNLRCAPP